MKCASLVKRFKHIKTEDKITRRKAGDFYINCNQNHIIYNFCKISKQIIL